jgi:hypothetical protein
MAVKGSFVLSSAVRSSLLAGRSAPVSSGLFESSSGMIARESLGR